MALRLLGVEGAGSGDDFCTGFWTVTTRVVTTVFVVDFAETFLADLDFEKKLESEPDARTRFSAVVIIV
jgi:hypothetical protein